MINMNWIRQRRKELGYSQDDLARILQLAGHDVVRTTISHWEIGRAVPPLGDPGFVVELAKALKLDATTVLESAGYPIQSHHSPIGERAARLIDTFDEDKQKLALRLVESLMD